MILIRIYWFFEFIILLVNTKRINQSSTILLIPKLDWRYFLRTAFVWDLELLSQYRNANKHISVVIGIKKVGEIRNKRVYYNAQYGLNLFGGAYENRIYSYLSQILEENGNSVSPKLSDIQLWENKREMYERFAKYGIPHPETAILKELGENSLEKYKSSMYIIKPSFSKSSIGITVFKDVGQAKETLVSDGVLILQRVASIVRDCRIIVINNKVVLQYWRNKIDALDDKEFVTTATGNGSTVLFNTCSKEIEDFALKYTELLGLECAAWDLIEEEGEIKALEVSPIYYPNASRGYDSKKPYRNYKKRFLYQFDMRYEFAKHIHERRSE